jgi:hypothetical protein
MTVTRAPMYRCEICEARIPASDVRPAAGYYHWFFLCPICGTENSLFDAGYRGGAPRLVQPSADPWPPITGREVIRTGRPEWRTQASR